MTAPSPARLRIAAFLIFQLALLTAGATWAATRYLALEAERALPIPQRVPLPIAPLHNDPSVVSDLQLRAVLHTLRPAFRGPRPKMNHIDHALRFWGVEATFDDPACLSGIEMRELLLDHRQYSAAWGSEQRPFLNPTAAGVRVRMQEGDATASHVDHTLACLAEVGTPLDFPVLTPAGETRLHALFDQSLRDFRLNQLEYEWSTLAYALYLPPTRRWFSTEGQEITFNRLARRLMRQRLSLGVCRGHHRLHTLVMLVRIDDQRDILSDAVRTEVIDHLRDATARLVASQHAEGWWDATWPGPDREGAPPEPRDPLDPLADRILTTGHTLEWWALAPPEVLPPADARARAGQWLCETIDDLTPAQVTAYYTYLSHAGRALALWRGVFPAEVDLTSLERESPRPESKKTR